MTNTEDGSKSKLKEPSHEHHEQPSHAYTRTSNTHTDLTSSNHSKHQHCNLTMSSYFSFSYQKLKKPPISPEEKEQQQQQQQQPNQEDLGVIAKRRIRWRRRWSFRLDSGAAGRRWRRPRLRISRLGRVLRRKVTVVGDKVKASVTKVVKRLKEGRPYIGDLFAGNYMFMQVAPSPTMGGLDKGFLPLGYKNNKLMMHPAILDKV